MSTDFYLDKAADPDVIHHNGQNCPRNVHGHAVYVSLEPGTGRRYPVLLSGLFGRIGTGSTYMFMDDPEVGEVFLRSDICTDEKKAISAFVSEEANYINGQYKALSSRKRTVIEFLQECGVPEVLHFALRMYPKGPSREGARERLGLQLPAEAPVGVVYTGE